MAQPCLVFSDLTLGYSRHPAVHHLSGTVATGSLTAVVGANGSGKSTLMKGIVGVLKPMDGKIVNARNARIAYLPQQSELDRTFPARVVDLVSLGVWPKRGLLGRFTDEDRASVSKALSAVGLEGFEKRPIDTLSGGQLQRALFARVLVQDAEIILLDEPFNAMDTKTVVDLIALIKRWHGESRTIMVVVHDLNLVREHFPETLLLARQPVAWGDTIETLRPENLLRARRFDEAWHDDAPWCEPEGDDARSRADHDHGTIMRMDDHDGHDHRHPAGPHAALIVMYDLSDRALRRIRLHAARAAGLADAVAERLPGRRVPDAAPHEPDRRRHGACDPAGCGGRLPALWAGDHPDDHRRPGRRRHRRHGRRLRVALHGAEGRRLDGRLLPDLARRRRADRVDARLQRRPDACAVRHGAGAQQRGAAADRR